LEDIKIRRLGWVDHIMKPEEERITKKILNGKFHNTRSVGRLEGCITDSGNMRIEMSWG